MLRFRTSFFHRSIVTPLLIALWLAGCTSWRTQPEPLQVVVAEKEPRRIRLTLLSGEVREFERPVVVQSTVQGWWVRDGLADALVQIPVDSVAKVETLETDGLGTAGVIVGVLAAVFVVAVAAVASSLDDSWGSCCSGGGGGEPISCPLVYSWDGSEWRLDSGTFGGAIFRPLARTDLDNLDRAVPVDGTLRLKLANERPEIEHVDAISVLAVDHAPGTTVVPDGAGRPHGLADPRPPVRATDERGENVLGSLVWSDGWTWESTLAYRDTADAASLRDGIELVFERPAGATEARLLLDGNNTEWAAALVQAYVQLRGDTGPAWYATMNDDPEGARAVGEAFAQAGFLRADLVTETGVRPVGRFWEAGPEITKRQVLPIDLTDVEGDRVRIRLSSLPSFWRLDRVAMDFGPEPAFSIAEAPLRSATRHDGADVRIPLAARDGHEWVMRDGDFAWLEFEASPVPAGRERSYLLRTHGWYQIESLTVGPPATALLDRLEEGPEAIARLAVALRNEAIVAALGGSGRAAPAAEER